MARFYPVYARRSDGKLEIIGKAKKRETNEPTADQLDQRPDKNGVADYYREVSPDESKHLDWRRKLGGMLARELGWKAKDGLPDAGYMLVTFPENYRLYEHVKKTEKDGSTQIKSKTHAAGSGSNDRQDAYLYGHPAGRKKRFRSPADFFPHLLWLCTDESGDPDNCGCKICSPEDLETLVPGAKPVKVKTEIDYGINVMRTQVKQEQKMPNPVERVASASQPRQLAASPLPTAKTPDQKTDQKYNAFTYRPGELVWFKRGMAWGLGCILKRWVNNSSQRHYSVQPLSQPYNHPQAVVKTSHDELRPWLAWSVPRYTIPGLNTLATPPTYDTADWAGMASGNYGKGDVEVDASIMAAKRVDASYTPFGVNTTRETESGVTETYYDGIYLGAEKCWLADPLRMTGGADGSDVFIPHVIVERTQRQTGSTSCYFTGDIYTLQRTTHSNPSLPTPAAPNNNPNLPARMTEDLAARNARSIPLKRSASFWKVIKTNVRLELNDIKGRWYEASLVMPILNPDLYKQLHAQGQMEEMSRWMNSRGDCQRPPNLPNGVAFQRQNVRRETRQDAFGRAIPPHARIEDGLNPSPENIDPTLASVSSAYPIPSLKMEATNSSNFDIDPRFETADDPSSDVIRVSRPGSTVHAVDDSGATGSFEDFMNLDGEDDVGGAGGGRMEGVQAHGQMPGFGAEYGSQGGGGYF